MSNIAIKAENQINNSNDMTSLFKNNQLGKMLMEYKTIPSLNGWRGIAVLLVILGHLKVTFAKESYVYKVFDNLIFAEFGVRIFFVLSGFLITTLLIKEKNKTNNINFKNFFIRRFFRIVPVLWLYILVVAIFNQIFAFNLSIGYFLGPILYINNFNFFPGQWILGHTWSLAVEEQYYLIWPFLFNFFKRHINVLIFIITIIPFIIVLTYFYPHLSNYLLMPFLQPAAAIFTGALLAVVWFNNFFDIDIQKLLKLPLFYSFGVIALSISILRHYGKLGIILLPCGDTILNLIICYFIIYNPLCIMN